MAIADLRNKLKASPVAVLEANDQALDKAMGRDYGNSDYHKVVPGRNVFRIYPPHESVDPVSKRPCTFAEAKVVTFLPAMVVDRDSSGKEQKDDTGKVKMKLGRKPVFNCTIHGKLDPTGHPLSKDAVDEFIRLCQDKAKALYPDDEEKRKKYLEPIYGLYSKDPNKKVDGITYNATWVCYADKVSGESSKFALLELKKAVKNRLNVISAIESGDDPLGTDPFTDIDEGRAVVIVYNDKAEQASDYYQTEIDSSTTQEELPDGRKVKIQKVFPLTDAQIEAFYSDKIIPLAKMFRNAFTRKDLDLQLWGLREIDKKYELGIFETDEFQTIAETIAALYPKEEENEETSEETAQEPAQTTSSKPIAKEAKKDQDDYDLMDREELKEFSKDNNTGILIKPESVMSTDALRDRLREWEASLNVTAAPAAVVEEVVAEAKVEEPATEESGIAATGDGTEIVAPAEEIKESAKERLERLKREKDAAQ